MTCKVLFALVLSSCGPVAGELPNRNTEIDQAAKSCSKPLYCGAIGYLDCNSRTDGPAYYFSRKTGRIIAACGGYCMDDPTGRCKTECPPAAWTCRKP
jgi:hypothetical protein